MVRFFHSLPLVLILLFLAGCGQAGPSVSKPPAVTEVSLEASSVEETALPAAGDILAQTVQNLGTDVQDAAYVLADDGAYDLAGVIQYLDIENHVQLAFVEWDGFCHLVGIAADGCYTALDGTLAYLGGGAVSLSLSEVSTGQILDYTVEFSKIEEGTGSNYTISAQERT